MKYLLGIDIGSSSVKGSLLEIESGLCTASAQFPSTEMQISTPKQDWAEQDPNQWWAETINVTRSLGDQVGGLEGLVSGIGISYQMHGLVCLGRLGEVLRPSIIWCDSRAVETGEKAFSDLGQEYCLGNLLNSPGNFTASKLAWVKRNEPEIFDQISKICLPGDFIAYKMSGDIQTTNTGLSEGIMFDFKRDALANELLEYFGFETKILPPRVDVFSPQAFVGKSAASELGISEGIAISYRSGDQPNNALSLGVFQQGQVAATGGTSGVVYGVSNLVKSDAESRVNTFLHVNHSTNNPSYGVLMCVNGCGITNRWVRDNLAVDSYQEMNDLAKSIDDGSDGLKIFPYGNGAERTLSNINLGSKWSGLDLNRHTRAHVCRAAQEGVVFAMMYGIEIMQELGVSTNKVRAGNANMFLSDTFSTVFAHVSEAEVEIFDTDGSLGAARGAGIGCGAYSSIESAFELLRPLKTISPNFESSERYKEIYADWKSELDIYLSKPRG